MHDYPPDNLAMAVLGGRAKGEAETEPVSLGHGTAHREYRNLSCKHVYDFNH